MTVSDIINKQLTRSTLHALMEPLDHELNGSVKQWHRCSQSGRHRVDSTPCGRVTRLRPRSHVLDPQVGPVHKDIHQLTSWGDDEEDQPEADRDLAQIAELEDCRFARFQQCPHPIPKPTPDGVSCPCLAAVRSQEPNTPSHHEHDHQVVSEPERNNTPVHLRRIVVHKHQDEEQERKLRSTHASCKIVLQRLADRRTRHLRYAVIGSHYEQG